MTGAVEIPRCACSLPMVPYREGEYRAWRCSNCDRTIEPEAGKTKSDHRFELEWKRRIRFMYPLQPESPTAADKLMDEAA